MIGNTSPQLRTRILPCGNGAGIDGHGDAEREAQKRGRRRDRAKGSAHRPSHSSAPSLLSTNPARRRVRNSQGPEIPIPVGTSETDGPSRTYGRQNRPSTRGIPASSRRSRRPARTRRRFSQSKPSGPGNSHCMLSVRWRNSNAMPRKIRAEQHQQHRNVEGAGGCRVDRRERSKKACTDDSPATFRCRPRTVRWC